MDFVNRLIRPQLGGGGALALAFEATGRSGPSPAGNPSPPGV